MGKEFESRQKNYPINLYLLSQGDEREWESFYDNFQSFIYRYLYKNLNPKWHRYMNEIIAIIYTDLIAKKESLVSVNNIYPWLATFCHNRMMSYIRDNSAKFNFYQQADSLDVYDPNSDNYLESTISEENVIGGSHKITAFEDQILEEIVLSENLEIVLKIANQICTPQELKIIKLFLTNKSTSEIAAQLNVKESSVHQYKYIAFKKIREQLKYFNPEQYVYLEPIYAIIIFQYHKYLLLNIPIIQIITIIRDFLQKNLNSNYSLEKIGLIIETFKNTNLTKIKIIGDIVKSVNSNTLSALDKAVTHKTLIFTLYFVYNYPIEYIAEIMDIHSDTISNYINLLAQKYKWDLPETSIDRAALIQCIIDANNDSEVSYDLLAAKYNFTSGDSLYEAIRRYAEKSNILMPPPRNRQYNHDEKYHNLETFITSQFTDLEVNQAKKFLDKIKREHPRSPLSLRSVEETIIFMRIVNFNLHQEYIINFFDTYYPHLSPKNIFNLNKLLATLRSWGYSEFFPPKR